MLTRDQKREIVKDLTQELKEAKGVVFSDFQGLPTKDIQELRSLLRKDSVRHKVVKLTLLKRAMNAAGFEIKDFNYQLPLAVSFSAEDEVMPAKVLQTFAKTHEKLKVVGGVLDKKLIDASQIKSLASLPTRQELYYQVVSALISPVRGLMSAMVGNIRGMINVLVAIKNVK
ncbi:MAG: 50S ribosomal protein L10 [Candidatus Doudnabacteria bacterium]|nr:50S ribosomal protein L10 [Candidatus Doudnabacteria bacterium]